MQTTTSSGSFRLLGFIFYSNYFYGLCAIGLSVEATLQQRYPLNNWSYFVLLFAATVLYYIYPYTRKKISFASNPRTAWYGRNYRLMRYHQFVILILLLLSAAAFLIIHGNIIRNISWLEWLTIMIFPLIGLLYYGLGFISRKFNIRKNGWLKPFIIGFTWAGVVTVYPVLFYDILHQTVYTVSATGVLLFIKNLMFIALLCIMFDIKDYATDYSYSLRTFVVRVGLRKTLFYILLPLAIIGLGTFLYYAIGHQFAVIKIGLNIVPFILLIATVYSLCRRRSLMYYLVVIDGLMLVKAICGSIAMTWF